MITSIGGLIKLKPELALLDRSQVAYATERTIVDKEVDDGSGLWMFVIMTIIFILVLKFGRKRPHSSEIENSEVIDEKGNDNIDAAMGGDDNFRQ